MFLFDYYNPSVDIENQINVPKRSVPGGKDYYDISGIGFIGGWRPTYTMKETEYITDDEAIAAINVLNFAKYKKVSDLKEFMGVG